MILSLALMVMQAEDPRDAWNAAPFRNQVSSFATFSIRRAFEDTTTEITLGTSESLQPGNYLFRRRITSAGGDHVEYAYTNSRDCSAALVPVRRLRRLRMPHPDVPDLSGNEYGIVVTDGARYVLEGHAMHPGNYLGDYRIESNVGTPLARWIDTMLAALEPCWSATARS